MLLGSLASVPPKTDIRHSYQGKILSSPCSRRYCRLSPFRALPEATRVCVAYPPAFKGTARWGGFSGLEGKNSKSSTIMSLMPTSSPETLSKAACSSALPPLEACHEPRPSLQLLRRRLSGGLGGGAPAGNCRVLPLAGAVSPPPCATVA